ncbi:hypothetical protein L228DRAFT_264099 [Xylona heveae TC161]|uniref:Uncharacterized protein n=1 Tax=Xylona heveae (strain CBS 132557 / TC161) TaxID=1328760 RepID=A0A164ZDV0_XYLHT|nr:hypothetical protein L228DRAFT_264099 [Xylona heveae TC161]KZF18977.1 hypothetical protein L228DRAFT_264099 [Xylona heveae TC161]
MTSTASSHVGPIRRLWFRWKSLRLPWRRQFLVGMDLAGNTYWEFKDHMNAQRLRRIVHHSRRTHYSDVQVNPQWHQWLRHVRPTPPSIAEQEADLIRQTQIKQLAARADERWASLPSYADIHPQPQPAMQSQGSGASVLGGAATAQGEDKGGHSGVTGSEEKEQSRRSTKGKDSWEQAQKPSNPGQDWQPESWSPSASKR